MLKIIFLTFFILGCDQFKDNLRWEDIQTEKRSGSTISIDCSPLFRFGDDLEKVHIQNFGRTTHYISGFQITKAKNCPNLRYTEDNIDIKAIAYLRGNKKIICHGLQGEKKIILQCPKNLK